MAIGPAELGNKDDCSGEDQQQFARNRIGQCSMRGSRALNKYVGVWIYIKRIFIY
jgi:hypothetical protein